MKTVFLISLILLVCTALSEGSADLDLDAISYACLGEAKITEKEAEDFYSDDSKFDTASANIQCHLKCVMEKLGELKGGVYDVEKAMKDWKEFPELAEYRITDSKVFAKCKNEKGANDCETAFKISKCIRQNKAAK